VLATKNHEFQDYSPTFYKPHTLKSLTVLLLILFIFSQTDFLE
jgi:phosphatidylserine synthase 2